MAKKKHRGHVNHERYLVTYSDLITLLLAFFIILYAMSENNPEKMKQLADAFTIAFHPNTESILENTLNTRLAGNKKREHVTEQENEMMKSVAEQSNLRKTKEQIDEQIQQQGMEASVTTTLSPEGLRIILTDEILFESGSANFRQPVNLSLIDFISDLLITVPNPVVVEGHTDNVPIQTNQFPSNWELSAARSLTVLRYMAQSDNAVHPERFSATGYGEFKPLGSNGTADGRKKNRRVEILIKRMNPDGLLVKGGGST